MSGFRSAEGRSEGAAVTTDLPSSIQPHLFHKAADQRTTSGLNPASLEISNLIGRGGPLGGTVTSTHNSSFGFNGNGLFARSAMKKSTGSTSVARSQG
jgi:hypothetical protein